MASSEGWARLLRMTLCSLFRCFVSRHWVPFPRHFQRQNNQAKQKYTLNPGTPYAACASEDQCTFVPARFLWTEKSAMSVACISRASAQKTLLEPHHHCSFYYIKAYRGSKRKKGLHTIQPQHFFGKKKHIQGWAQRVSIRGRQISRRKISCVKKRCCWLMAPDSHPQYWFLWRGDSISINTKNANIYPVCVESILMAKQHIQNGSCRGSRELREIVSKKNVVTMTISLSVAQIATVEAGTTCGNRSKHLLLLLQSSSLVHQLLRTHRRQPLHVMSSRANI